MYSFAAMAMSRAAAQRGAKQMIFDWDKAARLIKERKPKEAHAGLQSDWEYTGDTIWSAKGGPLSRDECSAYLSSNWATPELDLDGDIIPCFITADNNPNNWDSGTVWPESALAILNAK